jgi:formylglycine-generating enzyme required for sulfatase activity
MSKRLTCGLLFLGLAWGVLEGYEADLLAEPDGMVFLPGGCFEFGPSERACRYPQEDRAVESHCLSGFWIDRSEVTTTAYKKCVDAGVCPPPAASSSVGEVRQTRPGYPVVKVGWKGANKYCGWLGKRLPTDYEWERAARGPQMTCYPWGNAEPSAKFVAQHHCESDSFGLRKVCTKSGSTTREGVCDLADNALEFVAGWWDKGRKRIDNDEKDSVDGSQRLRILRGGLPGMPVRAWDRWYESAKDVDDSSAGPFGFRCAKSGSDATSSKQRPQRQPSDSAAP